MRLIVIHSFNVIRFCRLLSGHISISAIVYHISQNGSKRHLVAVDVGVMLLPVNGIRRHIVVLLSSDRSYVYIMKDH